MKDYQILKIKNVRLSFAWYDLWVGIFVDKPKRRVYVCIIPTILITVQY